MDEQRELRRLFNDWIDAVTSTEFIEGQRPPPTLPPPSHVVCNVSVFDCPSLLLEFNLAESKEQFALMIEKNDFLLKELSAKALIHPQAHIVIFRFVPCKGSFNPSNDEHLRNVKEENYLQASSIAAASWCKCPDRRSLGQTTATLKVDCANPDALTVCSQVTSE